MGRAPQETLTHERKGGTDCVNFQVGEFGSPSTIFAFPCGRESSSPADTVGSIDRMFVLGINNLDRVENQKLSGL